MQHLKTRAQFQALLATRPLALTPHFAMHWLDVSSPPAEVGASPTPFARPASGAWIGVMVPKRWAKRAVTRNLIKRQVYAVTANAWVGQGDGASRAAVQHGAVPSALPARPAAPTAQGACLIRVRSTFDRQQFVSARSDALQQAVRHELHELWRLALRRQPRFRGIAGATTAQPTVADSMPAIADELTPPRGTVMALPTLASHATSTLAEGPGEPHQELPPAPFLAHIPPSRPTPRQSEGG